MAPASCDDFQTFATLLLDRLLRLWGPLIHLEIPTKIGPAMESGLCHFGYLCNQSLAHCHQNQGALHVLFVVQVRFSWFKTKICWLWRILACLTKKLQPEVFVESMCRRLGRRYMAYDTWWYLQLLGTVGPSPDLKRAKLGQSCYDCIDGSNMAIPNR